MQSTRSSTAKQVPRIDQGWAVGGGGEGLGEGRAGGLAAFFLQLSCNWHWYIGSEDTE